MASKEKDYEKAGKKKHRLDLYLLRRLWHYVGKRWMFIIFTAMFLILSNAVNVAQPYIFKIGIDKSFSTGDLAALRNTSLILIGFLVLGFFLTVGFNYSIQKLGQTLIKTIRMEISQKMFILSKSYFDKTPTGRLLTLLTNDVESIRDFIANGVVSIIADFVTVIFIVGIMLYISPIFTVMVLLTVPIFALATYAFKVSLRSGYRGVRSANSRMGTLLVESITGIKEIFLFNHRRKSLEDFDQANRDYKKSFIKIVKSYSLYFPIIEGVSALSMLGILASSHFILQNNVSIGDFFAFFIYINMLFRPLRDLAEQFNTLQSAMSGGERIFDFLDSQGKYEENLLLETKTSAQLKPLEKLSGSIEFSKVSFSYMENKPVLKNISFKIAPGERVAIVGSTGAGKSTIVSLLPRLYDIKKGQIKIGGHDIKKLDLKTLRRNISTIPQNVFLLDGTFRENIDLSKTQDEKTIMEAARKALIIEEIEKRKKRLDAQILEEGKSLSTGQKQLLSFARAFVKDCPIVILDEATASIDSASERKIEQALDTLLKNRTAIIIAHRLSTIRKVDRIIVMHHGRIVEEGPHQKLIKIKDGFYRKLYSMQSIQLSIS
uniref:ABC transporter ATP-binding protein n=1 Tax=Magallana gigas TaxID=29159 RepID=K1Q6S5_MAGGI|eukprot:XP_011421938.1 PREDICTED: uncharacterized protein LOC105324536 [Crassostrea gigas]